METHVGCRAISKARIEVLQVEGETNLVFHCNLTWVLELDKKVDTIRLDFFDTPSVSPVLVVIQVLVFDLVRVKSSRNRELSSSPVIIVIIIVVFVIFTKGILRDLKAGIYDSVGFSFFPAHEVLVGHINRWLSVQVVLKLAFQVVESSKSEKELGVPWLNMDIYQSVEIAIIHLNLLQEEGLSLILDGRDLLIDLG